MPRKRNMEPIPQKQAEEYYRLASILPPQLDLEVHRFVSHDGRHFSTPEHADFIDHKIGDIQYANALTAQRKLETGFSIPFPPISWKAKETRGV